MAQTRINIVACYVGLGPKTAGRSKDMWGGGIVLVTDSVSSTPYPGSYFP